MEVYYRIVGRGTFLMSQLREGQRLDILGPLGRGFWVPGGPKRPILIGGGIGIAPLIAWAEQLQAAPRKRIQPAGSLVGPPEIFVLIGGKSREEILGIREFRRTGLEPQIATEDGSVGTPGMVTDLLERELMTHGHHSASLYACGPSPMLAKVAQIAEQFDLPCQVLLEARMACGLGACRGCAMKIKERILKRNSEATVSSGGQQGAPSGPEGEAIEMSPARDGEISMIAAEPAFRYVRACQEGPVFEAQEIFWE